jgi:hypothetical protein
MFKKLVTTILFLTAQAHASDLPPELWLDVAQYAYPKVENLAHTSHAMYAIAKDPLVAKRATERFQQKAFSTPQFAASWDGVGYIDGAGKVHLVMTDHYDGKVPSWLEPFKSIHSSASSGWLCGITYRNQAKCFGETGDPLDLGTAVDVAVGDLHMCVLRPDHTVECFGRTFSEILTVPAELDKAVAVSASKYNNCAIRESDKKVICWGQEGYASGPKKELKPTKQISTGRKGPACALSIDGDLDCWNTDEGGQEIVLPPNLSKVLQVSVGPHICALKEDLTVYCQDKRGKPWPSLVDGENQSFCPTKLNDFISISAGYDHVCGLHLNGLVECWGGGIGEDHAHFKLHV